MITVAQAAGPAVISLFTQYGQVTVEQVAAHSATYIDTQTKASQDSRALQLFLDKSLTPELMMRVLAQRSKYTIGAHDTLDGPTMYKVIISIVGTDTAASIAVINTAIRALPSKIEEFEGNITKFNEYVTELVNESMARGKTPHDLEYILYDSYAKVVDDQFVEYIRGKKSLVFDNTIANIESDELMRLAGEMYKRLVNSGEWNGSGSNNNTNTKGKATDDHIVALAAAIQSLQLNNKTGKKTGNTTGAAKKNTGDWKWKDQAPKAGESQFKTFKGKEYVHCPNHKTTKWVLADKHKDGCTLDEDWKYPTKGKAAATTTAGKNEKYLNAMMGLLDNKCSNCDEDEEV
jgi:hypothetical protein